MSMKVLEEKAILEERGVLGDKNYKEIYDAIDDKIKDLMHMADDLSKDVDDPEGKRQSDAMMNAANRIGNALHDLDVSLRDSGFFKEDK